MSGKKISLSGEVHISTGSVYTTVDALEALKAAGSPDKAAVKAALPSLSYTGVSGAIAFDDVGDAIRDTAYIKTADNAAGAWTLETVQTAK